MSYHERQIPEENLVRSLKVMDSDEGIRIDNKDERIFINRTVQRYCIDISKNNTDEFFYKDNLDEVMKFLDEKITKDSRIFTY